MSQSQFKILVSYIIVQIGYAGKAADIALKDLIVLYLDNLLLIHLLENKS